MNSSPWFILRKILPVILIMQPSQNAWAEQVYKCQDGDKISYSVYPMPEPAECQPVKIWKEPLSEDMVRKLAELRRRKAGVLGYGIGRPLVDDSPYTPAEIDEAARQVQYERTGHLPNDARRGEMVTNQRVPVPVIPTPVVPIAPSHPAPTRDSFRRGFGPSNSSGGSNLPSGFADSPSFPGGNNFPGRSSGYPSYPGGNNFPGGSSGYPSASGGSHSSGGGMGFSNPSGGGGSSGGVLGSPGQGSVQRR